MGIRRAGSSDLSGVATLASLLWPDEPASEIRPHMRALLAGRPASTLPLVVFVATTGKRLAGFIEVGLRSHADGCDGRRPVGFIEGWFVRAPERGRGVGRALFDAAERWAAAQGCTEMASDTWIDSEGSQRAHAALGFEIVDRCVYFRKDIRPDLRADIGENVQARRRKARPAARPPARRNALAASPSARRRPER